MIIILILEYSPEKEKIIRKKFIDIIIYKGREELASFTFLLQLLFSNFFLNSKDVIQNFIFVN